MARVACEISYTVRAYVPTLAKAIEAFGQVRDPLGTSTGANYFWVSFGLSRIARIL